MKVGGVKGLLLPFGLKNLMNKKQLFVEFCFENCLE
jgi:hypothetical protein